ncbi:hypothetical protein [Amnibacterium kyonggiense]|uniref:Uncharacterized protein n=1 Tax=Amnibacterium kyonggiense TaxID=595671 RepID=A0A4R7FL34_9MICO|nr:hypothetical protein [Amnibacterium kyonggiense]TDS77111.1 hypothetical protein CLV52_2051 [Amnibacterium kyonggiense]
MHVELQDRVPRHETAEQRCPVDGMPLYATIVGPRCPVCGAASVR